MEKICVRIVVPLFVLLCVSVLGSAVELAAGNLSEIKKQEGEFVSITGVVSSTRISQGGTARFLNFGVDYKNAFTAVIFKEDLEKFESSVGEPTKYYQNKNVRIEGRVKIYEGKPEIILNFPSQITVLENALTSVLLDASGVEKDKSYDGQLVTVTGQVISTQISNSGKARFLNLGTNPMTSFKCVIFTNDLENFSALGEPTDYYLNKDVVVTGAVTLYKGKPEIILKSPKQISVK